MCCRGERCFRINCHCMCCRCRNCGDCASLAFGKGGMGLKLAHHTQCLGKVSGSIVKTGRPASAKVPPPNPHAPPPLYQPPPRTMNEGQMMVKHVSKECVIQ